MRGADNLIFFLVVVFGLCTGCSSSSKSLKYGAVSSASPESTQIGMDILKKGGNAADAVVAIAFALGMSEPAMSGIGGGVQIQILLPGQEKPFAINGTTYSPSNTSTNLQKDSLKDIQRTTIPSMLKTLSYLKKAHGDPAMAWSSLIEPSIRLGKEGVKLGPYRMAVYHKYEQKLKEGLPHTLDYVMDSMTGRFFYPKLSNTYRLIAENLADYFYQGPMSFDIEEYFYEEGGLITRSDLVTFPDPIVMESVSTDYLGHTVYSQPEPCGGWVVLEILENLKKGNQSNEELLPAIYNGHRKRREKALDQGEKVGQGETTHFSVVDASGMWIGVTASINAYYGNGKADPIYGFLYNSYMDDFDFTHSNSKYAIGPQKMAYSSMSPTIVMKDGNPVLVIGSPGSSRIISTTAQLVHRFVTDVGSREHLLDFPRIHANSLNYFIEEGYDQSTISLQELGEIKMKEAGSDFSVHQLNPYFGGVHSIHSSGMRLVALADPRRDGIALSE